MANVCNCKLPFWFRCYRSSAACLCVHCSNFLNEESHDSESDDSLGPLATITRRAKSSTTATCLAKYKTPKLSRRVRTYEPSLIKESDEVQDMATDVVKMHIEAELHDRTYRDYPVIDFVEHVWGYKPQDLPTDRTYTLPFGAVNGYAESTERAAYVHLVELMTTLVAQVYPESSADKLAATDPSSAISSLYSILLFEAHDTVDRICANDPDVGCETARGNWEWFPAYGEVKKTCIRKMAYEADMAIDLTRLHKVYFQQIIDQRYPAVRVTQGVQAAHEVTGSNEKRKDSPNAETNRPHKKVCLDVARISPTPAVEKEMKRGGITRQEAQIGSCATELMAHNIRCYGTGIIIEDFMVKLWYADRHGVVVSRPFDMFIECDKLLLVVAAIAGADIAKMGVCPLLRFPSSKFNSYEDVKLVFQPGPMTKGLPEVKFTIDTSRIVETDFGIVGRGTTIIPLKATAEFGSEDLVAKMAWPSESRVAEADYIRVVRSRLAKKPQYLRHIVDMKCWISRTIEEIQLPRAFMGLHNFGSNNIMFYRDGGRVVGVLCDWDMATHISHEDEAADDDFENVVPVSIAVKTERTATADGKPTANADRATDEAGVANTGEPPVDGDVDLKTEARCKARYRTGTGPFMALDLLRTCPVAFPRYHYELQSFFFLLVWFCVVYDPVKHEFGHFPEWENSDMFTIGLNKREFLYDVDLFDDISSRANPIYQPLWKSWVKRLRVVLCSYLHDHDGIRFLKESLVLHQENYSAAMVAETLEEIAATKKRLRDRLTRGKPQFSGRRALGIKPGRLARLETCLHIGRNELS
ncbi:predicted protein [Postia placenta Mad-698-R]|nr:predicted protein [Postia placenta Mad-698-R]